MKYGNPYITWMKDSTSRDIGGKNRNGRIEVLNKSNQKISCEALTIGWEKKYMIQKTNKNYLRQKRIKVIQKD